MKLPSIPGSFVFFFLIAVTGVQAQDLTGIWRGHFRNNNETFQRLTGEDDRYRMEVQIAQRNKSIQAVTYSYKSTVFFGKAQADGTQDPITRKLLLRETKIVELRMAVMDAACIMTCKFNYSKLGDEEFLEGTFTSINNHDSSDCGKGSIFLHKVESSDFYKEPFVSSREKEIENQKNKSTHPIKSTEPLASTPGKVPPAPKKKVSPAGTLPGKTSPANTGSKTTLAKKNPSPTHDKPVIPATGLTKRNPEKQNIESFKNDTVMQIGKKIPSIIPKVLTSRANELVRTIKVNTADIQLNIYDDGAIDNDTVSVYFDKKLIVSNARLTDQAIVVNIHLDETSDTHELVMVAENEGDIPPNTSLMIVKAGKKEYEVRIVSTEQKNAVVIFKYEKPGS
jgi:hypothetical protein